MIKPGDTVIISKSASRDELATVERVTPSGRFHVRRTEHWLQEFNADGSERGYVGHWPSRAYVPTPEQLQSRLDMRRAAELREMIRSRIGAAPLATLEQIAALLPPTTP